MNGTAFRKMQKISVLGMFDKNINFIVLNFSTESAERKIVYDLLFLITLYFPKYENKHPSEMRN